MCTIVMIYRLHPEIPLVVAANRDEFYARGSKAAAVLCENPVVIGGRDLARNGTWLGATPGGFFVGLTNQRTYAPSDCTKRSRGEVALESLKLARSDGVRRYLQGLDSREYNPFNLCFGDARSLSVAYVRPSGCEFRSLPPGVHVLANDVLRSPSFPKIVRAEELVKNVASLPRAELFTELRAMLSDHALPEVSSVPKGPKGGLMPRALLRRLQALCIHTPVYGTVSATMICLGEHHTSSYLYADGAPCTHPFRDVTALFAGHRSGLL